MSVHCTSSGSPQSLYVVNCGALSGSCTLQELAERIEAPRPVHRVGGSGRICAKRVMPVQLAQGVIGERGVLEPRAEGIVPPWDCHVERATTRPMAVTAGELHHARLRRAGEERGGVAHAHVSRWSRKKWSKQVG